MRKRSSVIFVIIISLLLSWCPVLSQNKNNSFPIAANWFSYFDFDPAVFKTPSRSFGPFTRWWWPGNDVTNEELRREIKLFADNGFAGVEIQPLAMGINPDAPKDRLNKVYSWDSLSFYEHIKTVMQQAKTSGITVDLNAGSGWPIGGPQVKPEESMLTLSYSDTIINGGGNFSIAVPKHLPDYSSITIFNTHLYRPIDPFYSKLQAVVAGKILKVENGQTFLDPHSVIDLTNAVKGDSVSFTIEQEGEWKIIAYWCVPDGQIPTLIASRDPGLVANHFDSVSILRNYDYLFGEHTGIQQFYGNPMRAIFNDSYEFRSDRHYSNDFITFFKKQRGYNIMSWLGACLQKGYNNNAGFFLFADAKAPVVFSDEDWRIQYDYDLTVGELLQQQFIKASDNWMHDRGMLHRTQAYGVKMDVIAAAGTADIPEAEQLFAKGSEGFIKLITSGAHLHNKPVITQESFVFLGRSEMTTPQKLKALSDKAFTCGINQIIYSGTSYRYLNDDYGKEGWNTWSTPYSGFDFSSNVNESYTYWNDIKKVNEYITRVQYILRSGKPHSDVLVYFPFADFTQEDLVENPEEMFAGGYFKGVEPLQSAMPRQNLSIKEQWFKDVWQTINLLNAHGITWEWVNDASLQEAKPCDGNIIIRGNKYQALVIANVPYIQAATAENIKQLSNALVKILVTGNAPEKQPGFLNYTLKDSGTKRDIAFALQQPHSKQAKDSMQLSEWINTLGQSIKMNSTSRSLRTIDREMSSGSLAKFIWNPTDQWLRLSFAVTDTLENIYWLDAASGDIIKAGNSVTAVEYTLPPYGTAILYASKKKIEGSKLSSPQIFSSNAKEQMQLNKWDIRSEDTSVSDTGLLDWKTSDLFKYKATPGVYATSFILQKEEGKKYLIDFGKVYFTAEIKLNGKLIGKKIWSPYELEITDALQNGENKLEILVVPTQGNKFIYEADHGNKFYKQFKGKQLMPAGLAGPVRILVY